MASAEKLENTGPVEWEKVASAPQSERLVSTHFAKEKGTRAISPNHGIVRWERVKVGEIRTFARKWRVAAEA